MLTPRSSSYPTTRGIYFQNPRVAETPWAPWGRVERSQYPILRKKDNISRIKAKSIIQTFETAGLDRMTLTRSYVLV